jgi:hypothetical protein
MAGPDIKNIGGLPVPISVDATPPPEAATKNLDPLLDSLNTSAERFRRCGFPFLA